MQVSSQTPHLGMRGWFPLGIAFFFATALAGSAAAQGGAAPQSSETASAPRWACDQQTATAQPVWRGQSGVTFNFDIRNEGSAPLVLKAQGG